MKQKCFFGSKILCFRNKRGQSRADFRAEPPKKKARGCVFSLGTADRRVRVLLYTMATIAGVWEWRIVGGGEDRRHINMPLLLRAGCTQLHYRCVPVGTRYSINPRTTATIVGVNCTWPTTHTSTAQRFQHRTLAHFALKGTRLCCRAGLSK